MALVARACALLTARSRVVPGSQVTEHMFQRGRRTERTGGKLEEDGTEVYRFKPLDAQGIDDGRKLVLGNLYDAKVVGSTP